MQSLLLASGCSSVVRSRAPSTAAAKHLMRHNTPASQRWLANTACVGAAATTAPPVQDSSLLNVDLFKAFTEQTPPLPYAKRESNARRLVQGIVARAADRRRLRLADIVLDKEASLATGVITPGEVAGEAGNAFRQKSYTGLEALTRIERAMAAGRSKGAKAALRAVVKTRSRQLHDEEEAADAATNEAAVAKLSELQSIARSAGIRMPFLTPEELKLLQAYRARQRRSIPRAAVGAPAVDPTATRLALLDETSERLKNTLQSKGEELIAQARTINRQE